MWKVKAVVKLKEGVLDVQGRAVEQAVKHMGFSGAHDFKVGKYIEFAVNEKPGETVLKEIGEKLLANPVIETIEFSVEQSSGTSVSF